MPFKVLENRMCLWVLLWIFGKVLQLFTLMTVRVLQNENCFKDQFYKKSISLRYIFFLSLGFQDSDFLAGKYRSPVIYSFTCSICGTVLKTKRNYQRHMVMHSTARPHQCSLCDKSFKRQDHLKKHVDSVHLKKIPQDSHVFRVRSSCEIESCLFFKT